MTTQRALVAFPLRRESVPEDLRGYVLACSPREGRLASLMRSGLSEPPIMGRNGILIWKGTVYLEGETVPEAIERANAWRSGVLWDGEWREPTLEEWQRIHRGRSPW